MSEIIWSQLHFLRPHFLWLLIPACLVLYRWQAKKHQQDGWHKHCDAELLAVMQVKNGSAASTWRYLFWPVIILTILALAGPAVRQQEVPVIKNQAALILALDLSQSMLADDLKPNRLSRAKFKIRDLLNNRSEGLTALVVYAGDAFVVTPLTDDIQTIINLLDVMEPSIMPSKGTNTTAALVKSAELLRQSGLAEGQILLITDQVKPHKDEAIFKDLAKKNIKTHILAVGTAEGAPIKTDRGFIKDLRGQVVIPTVNFQQLRQAAEWGNGRFSVLSNQRNDDNLYDQVTSSNESQDTSDNQTAQQQFVDDGFWLLLLIVPLTALLYRRGMLLLLMLGFMIKPQISQALNWQDLWLNKDQQAYQKLTDHPELAEQLAKDPRIKAAAAYQSQNYQQTIEQLSPIDQPHADDYYNLGNAMAQAGQLEDALNQYKQSLALRPDDADTLYNKNIVEQALEQQEQEKGDGDQQDSNDEQKDGETSDSESDSDQSESTDQSDQAQESTDSENPQESQQQQQQAEKDAAKEKQENEQSAPEESSDDANEDAELTPEEQQKQAEEAAELAQQEALDAEEKQAIEQWLRRVEDDPGGLMRRKFLYQYHRRNQDGEPYDNQTTEDW